MTKSLAKPALISHVFFAADSLFTPGSPAREGLFAAWEQLQIRGFTGQLGSSLPTKLALPSRTFFEDVGVTTGARLIDADRAADGLSEAVVHLTHDVAVVSVVCSTTVPLTEVAAWDDLVALEPARCSGTLGSATIHLGLTEAPTVPDPVGLPVPTTLGDRWDLADTLWVWSAGDWPTRTLVAVADQSAESLTETWFWNGSRSTLPGMTRYLLNSTKLHYAEEVLNRSLKPMRDARADVERLTDQLSDTVRHPQALDLFAAERALVRLQSRAKPLLEASSDCRNLGASVQIALRNLNRGFDDDPASASGERPIDRDRGRGERVLQQLEAEQTYLDSTRARQLEVAGNASAVLDRFIGNRSDNLNVLQASAIGAIVMALAAIQSLSFRVPLPEHLQAPLICVLSSTALWLPGALLRWRPSGTPHRGWHLVDLVSSGAFGASVGWLVAGLVAGGDTLQWRWTLPVILLAATGMMVLPGTVNLVRARRRGEDP